MYLYRSIYTYEDKMMIIWLHKNIHIFTFQIMGAFQMFVDCRSMDFYLTKFLLSFSTWHILTDTLVQGSAAFYEEGAIVF